MKAYRARNKKTGAFWTSPKGKKVYQDKGALKGAYSKTTKWPNRHTFDEQDDYKILEYVCLETGGILEEVLEETYSIAFNDGQNNTASELFQLLLLIRG